MAHPKVSIIVPLYNKAPYVAKALESIASQTYKDWECIIVNDGSTDNSLAVVNDYCLMLNDERFRVIEQENVGVSAARNRGIAESMGEYICFLDADDWWAPEFIEEMMKMVNAYLDAGLWASNYWYVRNGKLRVGVKSDGIAYCSLLNDDSNSGYINYPRTYYSTSNMPVWTGAVMINRLKIEDCRLKNGEVFPVGITLGEDFLLWARIATKYPVAFLNKPLAYYNNDVLTTLRLTRNLHKPEAHMLWHLDDIEDWILKIANCELKKEWKILLDWLRVNGMMEYWLDERYHEAARVELEKIDKCLLLNAECAGNMQKALAKYKQPIWLLKLERNLLKIGSYIKQRIINH